MRSEFITTNGVRLHVVRAGADDGALVILLHGFPEFWYGWRHQIEPLARAGLRVWTPDQRGYNLSDKPAEAAAYGIDQLALDVVGLIDAAGAERASVVGHDWGAAVAWWLALAHPERLDRLVVMNVPHPLVMQRHLRRNPRQLLRSWYMFFFQLPWLPEALAGGASGRVLAQSLRRTSRPGTFTEADLRRYRQAWEQPGAVRSMIHWYRALLRCRPPRPPQPRVALPTLVVWGARDPFLGREMVEPSLQLCDHGQLLLLEDASHWVQHEEHAVVNSRLIEFLTSPARGAGDLRRGSGRW